MALRRYKKLRTCLKASRRINIVFTESGRCPPLKMCTFSSLAQFFMNILGGERVTEFSFESSKETNISFFRSINDEGNLKCWKYTVFAVLPSKHQQCHHSDSLRHIPSDMVTATKPCVWILVKTRGCMATLCHVCVSYYPLLLWSKGGLNHIHTYYLCSMTV